MKTVRENTKQAQVIEDNYRTLPSWKEHGLHTRYKSYSYKKQQAYDDRLRRARNYGTILDIKGTGNIDFFTLYIGVDCGNNERIIIKETASNTLILKANI